MFDAAVNQLRPQLVTIPGVAIPFPYGGKIRRDLGRPRPPGAAGARPLAGRRGERGQHAEPDPALGHRQVRRHRIQRADERLARRDRRPERPAGAHRGRRHHLPARRGPGARRLLSRRPTSCGRTASAACCCRCSRTAAPPRSTSSPTCARMLPRGDADPAARTSRSRRCSTSRCSSRRRCTGVVIEALIAAAAHRADGAALPRQLAQHADHRAHHPAVDPRLDPGALRAGRDAQHHDARRARAVGRHPGRPGDRDHREHRAPPARGHARCNEAILVGAGEIGVPAFVSTLCICIVFVPMFFLSGVARFLFVPMAEAVVFAMIASYILSRTLVPTLVMLLMGGACTAPPASKPEPAAAALPQLRRAVRARAARLHAGAVGAAVAARRPFIALLPRLLRAVVPALPGARAATSSRAWMPARSACTCARPPARASRRPRASPTRSRPRSAS